MTHVNGDIAAVLQIARDLRPDLWERTEQVARIIAPEAFAEGWIIHPPDRHVIHALKLALMRSTAMEKAQRVLEFLGVNTQTDWYEILERLAKETSGRAEPPQFATGTLAALGGDPDLPGPL